MIRIHPHFVIEADLGKDFILPQVLNELISASASQATLAAQVGHYDREGNSPEGVFWNSAHASGGCGDEDLRSSGGDGLLYRFLAQ